MMLAAKNANLIVVAPFCIETVPRWMVVFPVHTGVFALMQHLSAFLYNFLVASGS